MNGYFAQRKDGLIVGSKRCCGITPSAQSMHVGVYTTLQSLVAYGCATWHQTLWSGKP